MLKTRMGLASFVRTLGLEGVDLTQRLKRFDRIIGKLRRHRSMQVVTMQDIGGCRLVVPTLVEQAALAARIQHVWAERLHEVYDYVSEPKPSGYRAFHIVVLRDGRLIECQIRTDVQHKWADYVEALSRTEGVELKWDVSEEADQRQRETRELLRDFADVLAERDQLLPPAKHFGIEAPPLQFPERPQTEQ